VSPFFEAAYSVQTHKGELVKKDSSGIFNTLVNLLNNQPAAACHTITANIDDNDGTTYSQTFIICGPSASTVISDFESGESEWVAATALCNNTYDGAIVTCPISDYSDTSKR